MRRHGLIVAELIRSFPKPEIAHRLPTALPARAIDVRALIPEGVDPAEFFGKENRADLVAARRQVIEQLKARGLGNRAIAALTKRNISTVRYWLNPKTRQHRTAYKAQARAQA